MPMCRSPKIADVVLRVRKIPANDNGASVATGIRSSKPASAFKAAWQTCLIFLCVTVLFFFEKVGSAYRLPQRSASQRAYPSNDFCSRELLDFEG